MSLILCDIDGTLADLEHRRKYLPDWDKFFAHMVDDQPITPIIDLLGKLVFGGSHVVFVTGRPEHYRAQTEQWLRENLYYWPDCLPPSYTKLFMRKSTDHRSDVIVKKEFLEEIRKEHLTNPDIVLDDRQCVVDMWRAEGLQCLQVNAGDFDTKHIFHPDDLCLTIMVGPSGAGKSTFISMKFWLEKQNPHCNPSDVVSSDHFRELLTGDFRDQTKNKEVFSALRAVVKTRLEHGLSTVVDATNIRNEDRKALVKLAPKDCRVEYIVIDRPMEDKIRDGGWRNEVKVKGVPLMKYHQQTFNSNLKDILVGDNFDNVFVYDWRETDVS